MFQNLFALIKHTSLVTPVYAQDVQLVPQGQWAGLASLTVGGVVSGAISLVLLITALVFFFILVVGGLKWIMSGGDQKAVETARNQITNALIGLAIVFAAFAIISLIGTVFGISLTNFTIPTFH